ncbi:MAG: hypothetical protein RIB58_12655 [Phycisphaerales bacterium]
MRRAQSRRGVAVVVVLVVIAIGALAGAVALLAARSASEGASQASGLVQSRLTMRSAVLILEQEALAQREAVLGGADFDLEVPFEVFVQGGRRGVFRLDAAMTERPVSLDALLDVNTADAAMLARLPGVDESLAAAIAAELPVPSIGALLEVEGVTAEMLFGEYDEDGLLISELPPLASLLTVGSADPAFTVGVGSIEGGLERVDVSGSPDEATIGRAVELIGQQEGGGALARLLERSGGVASRADVGRALRSVDQQLATSGQIFDGVCFGAEPARGRVDINRAPVEVLATLPGFDADGVAQRLVDARQSLSAEDLASVLWPLEQGLVDEESMLLAVDRVTTRSVRWVLRGEAGMAAAARERSVGVDSLEDVQRIRAGMAAAEDDRLGDRVAMDLLVDFSGSGPVVVPLGEVTIAGELATVARAMRLASGDEGAMGLASEPDPEAGGRP